MSRIIEITGCSGSGKTTFARSLLKWLDQYGYKVRHNVSFSKSSSRQMLENVYWDIIALSALSFSKGLHKPFFNLAAHTLSTFFNAPPFSKMNIMRSVKRKVGTYEMFRKNNADDVISVMDEGPIHTAHVLFAHPLSSNNSKEYRPFCACVPVPDVLVYVRSDINCAVQRTLTRRDPPWKFHNADEVRYFMNNAHKMFETLLFESGLNERTHLVTVEDTSNQNALSELVDHMRTGVVQ